MLKGFLPVEYPQRLNYKLSAPSIKSLNVALLLFAWYLKGTKKLRVLNVYLLCYMIRVWNVALFDLRLSGTVNSLVSPRYFIKWFAVLL